MLICLALLLKVSVNFVYEDSLLVYLKILFIKIRLFPARKKKFNAKKYEKKKKKKADRPTHIVKEKKPQTNTKPSLTENINLITDIISVFLKTFSKHLHIKLAKIHIKVASPDAAQTAILYGAVSGSVAVLVDVLNGITNLDSLRSSSISVEPDFISEKPEAKINISLSFRVYGALAVIIKLLIRYIKHKFKK
ncbi:MAG: DUF2953 domain-containing protein [Eubacteriales bacterium]